MVTVTGFTAERMLVIENKTVVDGEVTNGNLILVTKDGTQIDAGSVIGPQGEVGPPGPIAYVGEIRMTCFTTVPVGWFIMNGQTIVNAHTLYPEFWAGVPASWQSAEDVILPDATSRYLLGGAPGEIGGNDIIKLQQGHMPAHYHDKGTLVTATAGAHSHKTHGSNYNVLLYPSTIGLRPVQPGDTQATGSPIDVAGAHTHAISGHTEYAGSGVGYEHHPQYMTVNLMIFAGPVGL